MSDPTVTLIRTGPYRCAGKMAHNDTALTVNMATDELGTTALIEVMDGERRLGVGVLHWWGDMNETPRWQGQVNIGRTTFWLVSSPGGILTFTRPATPPDEREMAALDAGDKTAVYGVVR